MRKWQNRSLLNLSGAVCLIALSTQTLAARTYQVAVYNGFDSGWSMDGGTIATQGFVGTIDETSDINSLLTDWSIGFTSPQGSFEFTPSNSAFMALDTDSTRSRDVVDVDDQDIIVLFDAFGVDLVLNSTSGQSILWDGPRFQQITLCCVVTQFGAVSMADGGLSSTVSLGGCEEGLDVGCTRPEGLLVAAVPEPSSLDLTVAAVAIAIRLARRRQRGMSPRHTSTSRCARRLA